MRRHLFRAVIVAALLAVSVAGYSYSTFAKWSSSSATFYVNPSNADISSTSAIWALQYAMNVWNNAGSSFHYQYGGTVSDNSNAYDNRNVILFRNQSNGSAIASTYSWWNSSNQLLDSDIVIWDGGFTFYAGTSGCGGIVQFRVSRRHRHARTGTCPGLAATRTTPTRRCIRATATARRRCERWRRTT